MDTNSNNNINNMQLALRVACNFRSGRSRVSCPQAVAVWEGRETLFDRGAVDQPGSLSVPRAAG